MLKRNSIIAHSFGSCQKWEPAGRIGDFNSFFNDFAKSPLVLPSSWIFREWNLYCKIVKDCILSEVCMIKTAPQSTVSPQMWCIKSIKCWFTRPQICWQVNLSNAKKFGLICFPRICFLDLIYCDQEPHCVSYKCDRRWLLFFVCAYKAINSL